MTIIHDKPLRAIIWCAVSTPEQAEDAKESLPAQEKELRALAERHKYEIVDVLIIPGFSRDYLDIYEFANDAAQQGIEAGLKLLYYMDDPNYRKPKFDVFLCRDSDRFGRTQSLLTRIAETILVKMNLLIHSQYDGLIDRPKARMFISMAGYRAAGAIDDLKDKRKFGMPARAKKGLALARKQTHVYRAVYDNLGNELGIEVDRSKQRLWDDLATLILEGISWNVMEIQLYERFGHVTPDGKKYKNRAFYDLIHTPAFWGHSAWNYRPRYGLNKTKTGFWVFDSSEPSPDGVLMFYDTHEPIYSGDIAERVKAELRRRRLTVTGRVNPNHTYKFTGLLVCASCGYKLSWNKSKRSGYEGYRCMSHFYGNHYEERAKCPERGSISVGRIQEWLDQRLRQLVEAGDWSWLSTQEKSDFDTTHQQASISAEIAELEQRARGLIRDKAAAPDGLQGLYDDELLPLAERISILRSRLMDIQHQIARANEMSAAQTVGYSELKDLTIDELWQEDETHINQLLHMVIGNKRLVISGGQIVGIADNSHHKR